MKKIFPVDLRNILFHSDNDIKSVFDGFYNKELSNREIDIVSNMLIQNEYGFDLSDIEIDVSDKTISNLRVMICEKEGGTFVESDE